ncbi:hypothetical protein ABZW32_18355 [Streptomyces sp. NPDC004667]|uniref:hypothetical protein n=1 Tax=Streptomyces sp. NPDC004667 TaxID=3154285 RepID=UPI0033B3DD51
MSEFYPPSEPSEQSGQPEPAQEGKPGGRKRLARVLPRGKGVRWAAAGVAAVAIVGGGAAAVAVAEHHERAGKGHGVEWAEGDHEGGRGHGRAHEGKGEREDGPGRGREGKGERMAHRQGAPTVRDGADLPGNAPKQAQAPAPLPSLPIGQAAEKAAGAVSGGKVEALRPVAQEGGGSAWLAVVLGPDGVRHAVTVSGSDGTVSGNVVMDGRQVR